MSYTNKCCGVCDEYVELRATDKFEYCKYYKYFDRIYKRFESSNVCESCINKKALEGVEYQALNLTKDYDDGGEILNKYVYMAVDDVYCKYNWFFGCYFEYPKHLVRLTKRRPSYYSVTGVGVQHEGLFTVGGICDSDKRKLRRTLRKLGVIGDVTDFIV